MTYKQTQQHRSIIFISHKESKADAAMIRWRSGRGIVMKQGGESLIEYRVVFYRKGNALKRASPEKIFSYDSFRRRLSP